MAAEGQSDRMVSDMGVQMKQRCITEFFHVEKKIAPIDIHQHLQNISRDQIGCEHSEMVGGVCMFHQWWQSGGNSGVEDKPHSGWPGTAVTP